MEGDSIAIIDVVLYLKMENNSTARRGGASRDVIHTGVITIHHIRVGDDDSAGSSNSDNNNDYIVLSDYSSYWGRTTKRTKEEILR